MAGSDTQRAQEVGPRLPPSGQLCPGSQGPRGPDSEVSCRKTLAWDKTPQKSWQQAKHYRHPPTEIRGARASSPAFPYPECPFTDGNTEASGPPGGPVSLRSSLPAGGRGGTWLPAPQAY